MRLGVSLGLPDPVDNSSRLPAADAQTLLLSMDGTIGAGTFSRSTNAWNPETGLIAANNIKLHSEFENGVADLSTLQNVSIGSLTGFTNAAVFASGFVAKYFQWGAGLVAPAVGEPRVYSCYIQMTDLSAPDPSTGIVAGKDMFVSQGVYFPTYIGKELVDPINAIYRVYWASTAGDNTSNVYLQQTATGSGKSFKASGCMIERVSSGSVTTPSPYIKTTSAAVYSPRYVTGKSGQGILIEESSTNVFLNSVGTAVVTQSISVTTAGSGKWTCSVSGAGTVTSSAGTATATGYGVATSGSPNTITVTGNGTVIYTVAGIDATTKVQVENLAYPTSHIETGASSTTRGLEYLSHPNTGGYLPTNNCTILLWVKCSTIGIATTGYQALSSGVSFTDFIQISLLAQTSVNFYLNTVARTVNLPSGTWGDGTWRLLSVRHSSTQGARFGINSTFDAWQAGGTGNRTAAILNFGRRLDGPYNGNIDVDNVRIFNRVLTDAEIVTYYNRGK